MFPVLSGDSLSCFTILWPTLPVAPATKTFIESVVRLLFSEQPTLLKADIDVKADITTKVLNMFMINCNQPMWGSFKSVAAEEMVVI